MIQLRCVTRESKNATEENDNAFEYDAKADEEKKVVAHLSSFVNKAVIPILYSVTN